MQGREPDGPRRSFIDEPKEENPVTEKTPRLIRRLAAGALCVLGVTAAQAAPVTLNVVDVAGNLALTQEAFEAYRLKNPAKVERFTFTKATAPELPGKLKAMQGAGRSDIDIVLTGTDALAAGVEQNLWVRLLPDHQARFKDAIATYTAPAAKMQELAGNQGLVVTFMPAGPLIEYNPDKVRQAPTTPAELLAWCKANPNRLIYARPANSGPGRTFMMGLPYLLGDKDPKDPIKGWDKTWAYLKDLDGCIEYYPTGTGAVMKELGDGSRDMTVTMTGWDINPRALGVVPKNFKVGAFKGMTWINDAHYMVVPKGVTAEKLAVILDIMNFMLQPPQQALTYDKGYFYPGPAVRNVPVSMAPKESQDVIREYGRPEYEGWLTQFAHTQPLDAKSMVDAFKKWDEEVGAQKAKK
jgi:putative spermidine/putrescine transport system substrate-binding protein